MLNTHSYDGKLNISSDLNLSIVHQLSLAQKQTRGRELLDACQNINTRAFSYLNSIVQDMGTYKNVDNSHHPPLIADDLICLCWEYRDNPEFISELEIQLMDMATGFCPQGRTHRLFQILMAFK